MKKLDTLQVWLVVNEASQPVLVGKVVNGIIPAPAFAMINRFSRVRLNAIELASDPA